MGEPQQERIGRIAIINADKCKPMRCKKECKTFCPVVRVGKSCVEVDTKAKLAWISEDLCVGCGICTRRCPYNAVTIVELPSNLANHTTHRFGPNGFKLHRLPVPKPNQVLGLVGPNAIGKSTALGILAGKMKPNLGRCHNPPDWDQIIDHFQGSKEQRAYFAELLENKKVALSKPQYVCRIPTRVSGTVGSVIMAKDDKGEADKYMAELELNGLENREIKNLSGSELQRFAIAVVCIQKADVYTFDEPSSYLDVRQRVAAAKAIRSLLTSSNHIICADHDLTVLDYLSDSVCCFWGSAGNYGVVTMPFSVREGINIFLDGVLPMENFRFREASLKFTVPSDVVVTCVDMADSILCATAAGETIGNFAVPSGSNPFDQWLVDLVFAHTGRLKCGQRLILIDHDANILLTHQVADELEVDVIEHATCMEYPNLVKSMGTQFKLAVEAGSFSSNEIVVLLGQNGTGKTTFIRMWAGMLRPDGEDIENKLPELRVAYKPQTLSAHFQGTVEELFLTKIRDAYLDPQFQDDVVKPMNLEPFLPFFVDTVGGGALQRVALILALGKPADIYLLDEPLAYLDVEQRIVATRVIKRFIRRCKKAAFVVEHDFIMATYLADKIVVFEGKPGVSCTAASPSSLFEGVNLFLEQISITCRQDAASFRPRINKGASVEDREQKESGNYFVLED